MSREEKFELKYIDEHLTCRNYLKEVDDGFTYREFKKGERRVSANPISNNCLVVVLSGRIRVSCGVWINREIGHDEVFLVSRSSHVRAECLSDCRLLILAFDTPATTCDKLDFLHLAQLGSEIDYNLNTLPVRAPLSQFVDLLICYLSTHANCLHLHEMKRNELFLCLRFFYTKKELASLFHPMLSRAQDFRSFVLENYPKAKSAKELVALSHMSRSVFYNKFSAEFGMPAKQWLTEKFLHKMVHHASEPGVNVKKLMIDLDFESLSQFQVYCKRNFGCTPSQLISRSIDGSIHYQNTRER